MNLRNILANILRDFARKLDNDECELSAEEQEQLLAQIAHIPMNKTEAANYLNMSVRTFDRHVSNGDLPNGKHTIGSKQLYWYKDELITIKNENGDENNI